MLLVVSRGQTLPGRVWPPKTILLDSRGASIADNGKPQSLGDLSHKSIKAIHTEAPGFIDLYR